MSLAAFFHASILIDRRRLSSFAASYLVAYAYVRRLKIEICRVDEASENFMGSFR